MMIDDEHDDDDDGNVSNLDREILGYENELQKAIKTGVEFHAIKTQRERNLSLHSL